MTRRRAIQRTLLWNDDNNDEHLYERSMENEYDDYFNNKEGYRKHLMHLLDYIMEYYIQSPIEIVYSDK